MLARQWQTGEFEGEDSGSPIKVTVDYATQPVERVRLEGEQTRPLQIPTVLGNNPLEMVVEQERLALDWRTRVQVGQRFERAIRVELTDQAPETVENTIDAYRQHYSLDPPAGEEWTQTDSATRRYLKLACGRVVDGGKLLEDVYFSKIPSKHQVPALGNVDSEELDRVVTALRRWCRALNIHSAAARPGAWRTQQLDYRFQLSHHEAGAASETCLLAPGYRSGDLDWYTFNARSEVGGDWTQRQVTTHPTRISVGGTSPRWWAFEDAATDFGQMDVDTTDLARLALMQFVLIYGDDWFGVPLPVRLADPDRHQPAQPQLARIKAVRIQTVFGEELILPSARRPDAARPDKNPLLRWEVFTLSVPPDPARPWIGDPDEPGLRDGRFVNPDPDVPDTGDILLIMPTAAYRQESPPIEEVRFLRDEGANMVWAVEQWVVNGLGRPAAGFNAQQDRIMREREATIAALVRRVVEIERELAGDNPSSGQRQDLETEAQAKRDEIERLRAERAPASDGGVPRYRLATEVPENWIPFVPAQRWLSEDLVSVQLRRAQMLSNVDEGKPVQIRSMSRLLELDDDPLIWPPELDEEVVPSSGLRVQLTGQRVRWMAGKTYVWLGRKVLTGRGEGSSGLRFDVLTP
jgi:hypothetical protein